MTMKYTKDHEWILIEGESGTVGITDYAQKALGDIVFVELPELEREVEAEGDMAVVESVKAASEVYAPVDGVITAVNEALEDNPALVNESPEQEGWFVKLSFSDPSQLDGLMEAADYRDYIEGLED